MGDRRTNEGWERDKRGRGGKEFFIWVSPAFSSCFLVFYPHTPRCADEKGNQTSFSANWGTSKLGDWICQNKEKKLGNNKRFSLSFSLLSLFLPSLSFSLTFPSVLAQNEFIINSTHSTLKLQRPLPPSSLPPPSLPPPSLPPPSPPPLPLRAGAGRASPRPGAP